MKRCVWLGLVGGLVACGSDSPVEPQACPGTTGMSEPIVVSSASQSEAALASDGSEEVIIAFRQRVFATARANTEAFAEEVGRAGGTVQRRMPTLNMVSARVSPAVREALARNPDVVAVSPDREVRALGLMQRPLSPQAWLGAEPRPPPNTVGSVGEYTEGLKLVQANQVWDANDDGVLDDGRPSGTGVKVCVIDSGWDNRHPELQAAFIGGKDFISGSANALALDARVDARGKVLAWGGGHGTHTAATIAAQLGAGGRVRVGNDPNGTVGVAPTASLLIARVLNETGSGSTTNVIAALDWCQQQGANIVSLSLGASTTNAAEELAFNQAKANGVLAIAATGNSGEGKVSYPAGYDSVVGVGAVNFAGEWAAFSQYGEGTNLVGPGVGVLSATIVGGAPYGEVAASGQQFESNPLEYSALGAYTGRLVNCGLGASVSDCGEGATCEGFVAYVDRGGGILFEEKVRNAIRAGAKAVIIGNHIADEGMGNFTLNAPSSLWVPTVSVSLESANLLRGMAGQEVALDVTGLDYAVQTGTSMATPHVAGVAALVWSLDPQKMNAERVREALLETAKDLGPAGWDPNYGNGLVQAADAVRYAEDILTQVP